MLRPRTRTSVGASDGRPDADCPTIWKLSMMRGIQSAPKFKSAKNAPMNIILRMRAAVQPCRSVRSSTSIAPVHANSISANRPNRRLAYPAATVSHVPRTARY